GLRSRRTTRRPGSGGAGEASAHPLPARGPPHHGRHRARASGEGAHQAPGALAASLVATGAGERLPAPLAGGGARRGAEGPTMRLRVVPVTIGEARAFVEQEHLFAEVTR